MTTITKKKSGIIGTVLFIKGTASAGGDDQD